MPADRVADIAAKIEAAGLLRDALALRQAGGEAASVDAMLDAARSRFVALLERHPIDPQALGNLGTLELEAGDVVAAQHYLERHAEVVPADPARRLSLARCYQATGRPDWALAEAHKVVAIDPAYPAAYQWLAAHHAGRGEPGRAVWWLGELQRNWRANEARRAELDAQIASLRQAMLRAGQEPTAPASFPPSDLRPAGLGEGP